MHKALFYKKMNSNELQCQLCPHMCVLSTNQIGKCNTRQNIEGELYNLGYGKYSALAIDPVEKKPLYHFHPGAEILSIGGFGCNFTCSFCQNHQISQIEPSIFETQKKISPEDVIRTADKEKPKAGIAFTYNEPVINIEFILETFKLAKEKNIPTSIVSNGFINPKPLNALIKYTDAFSIDLKGFTEDFYKQLTCGTLWPVLNTIDTIAHSKCHLEITHLLITNANDNLETFTAMCQWIQKQAGINTPLHISRYFPNFQYRENATNTEQLDTFINQASKHLTYVYGGNYNRNNNTFCPNCGIKIIERTGYKIKTIGLNRKNCLNCNIDLPIIL